MKKITLTSVLGLALVCPAFATVDINADANSAGCNNTVLHTYSGPTSLEADWSANTITLNWYNDSTKITPSNSTANSCTYDGAITLPNNEPTKTGYTFGGWRVRISGFDLSTLNASINGSASYGYGWNDYNNEAYCSAYGDGTVESEGGSVCTQESAALSDLAVNEWKTEFSYGTVYGEASCQPTIDAGMAYLDANIRAAVNGELDAQEFLSTYAGLAGQAKAAILQDIYTRYLGGQITYEEARAEILSKLYVTDASYNKNSTGQYCWCKATGYKPLNGNKQNVSSSLWVFNHDYGSAASCASDCTSYCGSNARYNEALRVGLFGSVAQ